MDHRNFLHLITSLLAVLVVANFCRLAHEFAAVSRPPPQRDPIAFDFIKPNLASFHQSHIVHEPRPIPFPSPPNDSESVLFPDWDVFILLPHGADRRRTSSNFTCVFIDGSTSPANYAGLVPSSGRHGFLCRMPRGVQRRRPFRTPQIIADTGPVAVGSDRTTEMMRWNRLAYESYSTADDVIVFAKGINRNQGKDRPAGDVSCVFIVNGAVVAATNSSSSAQEVFRCPHPPSTLFHPTASGSGGDDVRVSIMVAGEESPVPSLAAYRRRPPTVVGGRRRTCACTMVYNAGKFVREWVTYHAAIGVERFVLYDNGSDDGLAAVVAELAAEGHDVSSVYWPWQKTNDEGLGCSHLGAGLLLVLRRRAVRKSGRRGGLPEQSLLQPVRVLRKLGQPVMVIMAHGADLPFVLSLLLLFFVSCSRISPAASSTEVPLSVSAKAAAVQYWNRVVGSNSQPPPVLLAHLSDISPLDIIANLNKVGLVFGDEARDHASNPGSDDNHAISHSPNPSGKSDGEAKRGSDSPDPSYKWMPAADGEANQRESMSHDGEQGIFFRKKQLKKGTTMHIADFGREAPHQDFLPRNIASRIPQSEDAIRKLFRIPADAPMGKSVTTAIELCKEAPVEGQTRRCVTSAEDMIDYVVSSLGAKSSLTAKSTSNSNGLGSNVLIGEVKAVGGGELGRVVSCHHTTFPYLMYQCHSVPKTVLYDVEILDPETKGRINLAAAICHFDTSVWSPRHAAFEALVYERGMDACHWVFPMDMAWTAAAE